MKGFICKWDLHRGFGFIKMQGAQDIYAHVNNFAAGHYPRQGVNVVFNIGETNRNGYGPRPIATDIKVVGIGTHK